MKPSSIAPDGYSFATQPIVRISTQQTIAHEVLLREFKNISISDFLDNPKLFLEHNISMCQCIAEMQRELTKQGQLKILFVNFRPDQIAHESFKRCLDMFYLNGVLPSSLAIEVTENNISTNESLLFSNIQWAREMGHPIIVDDFGDGISNFGQVARLRPSIVKTDMSLIRSAGKDAYARKCLRALIHYIQEIGAKSVIEGVETLRERDIAEELGGTFGQGFYFGKPNTYTMSRRDLEGIPKKRDSIDFFFTSQITAQQAIASNG